MNASCCSRAAEDVGDFSDAQEIALFHDGDGGTHFLEVREDVGSDEDGFAFPVELSKEVFELDAGFGIEAGSGLVENEKRRIVNNGASDTEALLHAAGEAVDHSVGFGIQADLRDGVADAGVEEVGLNLVAAGEMVYVFPDFEIAVDGEEVREVADVLLGAGGMLLNVDVVDRDFAGGGSEQTTDHFEGGGFAGAVGTDEAKDFALWDMQGEMVGGNEKIRAGGAGLVVLLGDVGEADHRIPGVMLSI